MGLIITKATENDLAAILILQKDCYLSEAILYDDYEIPPLLQDLNSILEEYRNGMILTAYLEDRLIGSVRAYEQQGTCFIGKLMVKDEFQNMGIGKQLMKAIELEYTHCKRYELFTGHKSLKNLGLYQKLGYSLFAQKKIHEGLSLCYLEKNIP